MSAERNWSPSKAFEAFEALTPQPVTGFWNTSRSGIRVDVAPPKPEFHKSTMPSAFVKIEDNVDVYDAAQIAVFFAKLAVHLGNEDARIVALAGGGEFK